jgi:tetratricopeptide (TPR) repeat protein
MGFRMRRSIKVAPGVRLNVSRSGVGMSAGVKGARYAAHSSGRRTTMIGNPIFGVGYMDQTTGGRKSTRTRSGNRTGAVQAAPAAPTKPGLFAPKGEKRLWKAGKAQDASAIAQAGEEFPDYRVPAYSVAGFLLAESEPERAAELLAQVLETGEEPARNPFIEKYVASAMVLPIAPGVEAELPLCRDALGLLLAELRQEAGDLEGAIDAVEQLEPTTYAAVSLAELYSEVGRHDDVIELTEGLAHEDDASALLLVYRGIAMRERGYLDASLDALKEALRSRSRDSAIRNLAYSERAKTYVAQGKKGMARKDLERILAADSSFEGVRKRLEELA